MKKKLPLLILLLVLTAVIALTKRRAGSGGAGETFTIDRAAEWAPRDATFFLAVPDIERMVARWRANHVQPFSMEAKEWRWQEAFGLLPEQTQQVIELHPLLGRPLLADEFERVPPAALWIAAKDISTLAPKVVIGLRYRAKKSEVEGVIRRVKDRVLADTPDARSELSREHGVEVESIVASGVSKQTNLSSFIAFRDDWVFLATDRAMLSATLASYVGAAGASKGLAANSLFAECRAHALPEADFCMWSRWRKLPSPVILPGREKAEADKPLAVHFECRVDGATSARLALRLSHPAQGVLFRSPPRFYGSFRYWDEEPLSYGEQLWRAELDRNEWVTGPRAWILAALAQSYEAELEVVFPEGGWDGWPDHAWALGMCEDADAFHLAAAIAEAEREAPLEAQGLGLSVASGTPAEGFSLACGTKPEGLGESELWRPDWTGEGVERVERPVLRITRAANDSPRAVCLIEMPELIDRWRVELPYVSLPYEPWLLPRGVDADGAMLGLKPIRLRKAGSLWTVDSDLNLLGPHLLGAWMGLLFVSEK